ncbi:MAG: tetratricopeptide repeat protein [Rhodocyclaceae bacterium]|nr:tetratricopeptide repeat protein [Rhodocyclaceae bacterium]
MLKTLTRREIDAADQLRDTGQLDAAVLAYQAIISVAPNVALAHYKLGTAYQRANRLEEAAESFKLAINLRPGYPEANNNLGIILSKQGNDADAEVCYRNAVAENTDYFEAHLNLGNMFRTWFTPCRSALLVSTGNCAEPNVGKGQRTTRRVVLRSWFAYRSHGAVA